MVDNSGPYHNNLLANLLYKWLRQLSPEFVRSSKEKSYVIETKYWARIHFLQTYTTYHRLLMEHS